MTIEELNKFNPNPGIPQKDYIILDNEKPKIKLYKWMIKPGVVIDDEFVPQRKLDYWLKNFCIPGFTVQLYYDIIVLGLTNETQRPRCPICGNELPFLGIGHGGYKKTCSSECHKAFKRIAYFNNPKMLKKGDTASLETKAKISEASKKSKSWENPEWKRKHSEYMKAFAKTPEGKEFYRKTGEATSRANIQRALNTNKPKELYNSKLYHKGIYHSDIYNMDYNYDSGWELEFIKYMETDEIKKQVKVFDRSRVAISYEWKDGSKHKYLPDFYILFDSGIRIVIEIKPNYLLTLDEKVGLKIQAGKEYFKKKNIQYIVLTEKQMLSNNKIKRDFNLFDFINQIK